MRPLKPEDQKKTGRAALTTPTAHSTANQTEVYQAETATCEQSQAAIVLIGGAMRDLRQVTALRLRCAPTRKVLAAVVRAREGCERAEFVLRYIVAEGGAQ